MTWPAIVAAVAAVLTALTAMWRLFLRNRPRVRVRTHLGAVASTDRSENRVALVVSASNKGPRAITVSVMGFLLPDGRELVFLRPFGNVSFPYELRPEKSCTIWPEIGQLASSLESQGFSGQVKLVGFCRDQVDRVYRSKAWKFDVVEWKKQR